MNPISKRSIIFKEITNIFLVVIGSALLAFGTAIFIIPFDLVAGGVSGIGIILERIIPAELGVDVYVAIISWLLFFVGLFILGRGFALKTLVSTIVYPLLLSAFLKLVDSNILNGFFVIKDSIHGEISLIIAAVFGGVMIGAGCAVTFLGGGSTGGVDIIAFTICKFIKRAKNSVVIFAIDAVVVISGMFIIGDLILTLLAIASAFISALVIDYIFVGSSDAFVAQIISENHEEINSEIIKKLDRTTTVINVQGGYSGKEKKLLLVSFGIREYSQLLSIVNSIDKNAFITINKAHEINGEGWTYKKTSG